MQFARELRGYYGIRAYIPWKQVIGYTMIPLAVVVFDRILAATVIPGLPLWSLWMAVGIMLAIPLGYVVWATLGSTDAIRRWLRKGDTRDALGEQAVTIDPDAIRWSTRSGEFAFKWWVVSSLEQTPSFIVMNVGETTLVIPLSAFSDAEHATEFLKASRRFRQDAPPTELRCPHCSYDFTGRMGDGCPECGWDRAAAQP